MRITLLNRMDTGLRVVSKEKDSITLEMVKYDNTIPDLALGG